MVGEVTVEFAVEVREITNLEGEVTMKKLIGAELDIFVDHFDIELWFGAGQSRKRCKHMYGVLCGLIDKVMERKMDLIEDGVWVEDEFNEVFGKLFDYKAACFKYSE